jgi:hypothetical protein
MDKILNEKQAMPAGISLESATTALSAMSSSRGGQVRFGLKSEI